MEFFIHQRVTFINPETGGYSDRSFCWRRSWPTSLLEFLFCIDRTKRVNKLAVHFCLELQNLRFRIHHGWCLLIHRYKAISWINMWFCPALSLIIETAEPPYATDAWSLLVREMKSDAKLQTICNASFLVPIFPIFILPFLTKSLLWLDTPLLLILLS